LLRTKGISEKDDPADLTAFVYTLHATQVLRGTISQTFRVYEGNDSGRATFGWKNGRSYLLFLFPSFENRNAWSLDGCGNSGPLGAASATLKEIRALQANKTGMGWIYGIVSGQAFSDGLSGVSVEARNGTSRYRKETDDTGHFRIEVPVGTYSLRATRTGMSFVAADISYSGPERLRVFSGGCVQVQLAPGGKVAPRSNEKKSGRD